MSTFSLCVLGIGFVAIAAFLVIHFVRDMDMRAPTQGDRIREALMRLEEKSSIM